MTGFLHQLGTGQSGIYSYVSKPTTVSATTGKVTLPSHRDAKPLNLMHDRRVVRGNTYSTVVVTQVANRPQVKPSEQGAGPLIRRSQGPLGRGPLGLNAHRKPEPRRRGRLSDVPRLSPARLISPGAAPLGDVSPPPGPTQVPAVPGRRHLEAQTDQWLEELGDRAEEAEAAVQCGEEEWGAGGGEGSSLLQPPTAPIGHDKETQIFPNDPLLFLFDKEVVVVLEAIIGRTLEQSLVEVLEEEETALAGRQRQEHLELVKTLQPV